MKYASVPEMLDAIRGAVQIANGGVTVSNSDLLRSQYIDRLAHTAAFGDDQTAAAARWIIWNAAWEVGVKSASIDALYQARSRGEYQGITVPAVNVRGMAYDTAKALVRAARAKNCGAFIFELARSEMGYTEQTCEEYATVVTAASIREGLVGPIFIQGDHYQANAGRYKTDPEKEIEGLRTLIRDAISAGYGNIDIDTSTLVTLEPEKLVDQQYHNFTRTAELATLIRQLEPPGVTISIGGEIGEVGKYNSTVEELTTYLDGFAEHFGGGRGLSKISVQTGTSHGGVVLPDGSIAQVKIDLEALAALSRVAREEYGLAGAVQHGASTLPSNAFGNFPRIETAEIHLATNFQNIVFDHPRLPAELRERLRAWVDENAVGERKSGDTNEQFYYKARKKAIGPFKREFWSLPNDLRAAVAADLERTFAFLFQQLNVNGTEDHIHRFVQAPLQHHAALKPALVAAEDDADAGE